mmetsp:Transcript_6770/g.20533  ORF Transcript_6770/g.20533 Transcript_6770/m.20533 type:complete len:105 (-) Transcript_6770:397-711(-)
MYISGEHHSASQPDVSVELARAVSRVISEPRRFISTVVHNSLRLEELDELLVQYANFVASEASILLEYGCEGPSLYFAQTSDETPSPVFPLVAVYENRVIPDVQ